MDPNGLTGHVITSRRLLDLYSTLGTRTRLGDPLDFSLRQFFVPVLILALALETCLILLAFFVLMTGWRIVGNAELEVAFLTSKDGLVDASVVVLSVFASWVDAKYERLLAQECGLECEVEVSNCRVSSLCRLYEHV